MYNTSISRRVGLENIISVINNYNYCCYNKQTTADEQYCKNQPLKYCACFKYMRYFESLKILT